MSTTALFRRFLLAPANRVPVVHPQNALADRLSDLTLEVHDPFSWMLRQIDEASTLLLYGDGIHLSDKGHGFLAGFVLDRVVSERRTSAGS